jgi:dihydroorotate dehydrogenase electron transfer subunit
MDDMTTPETTPMPKFQEDAELVEQRHVAAGTYRMRLMSPQLAAQGRPGQFLLARVVGISLDPLLRRPFSFHRLFPNDGIVEILYKVVGRGTLMLSHCRPGTRINVLGPLGNGFSLPEERERPLFLVAGGIGIAPLFAVLDQALAAGWDPSRLHLFYGARGADELLAAEEFASLGIPVRWSTDDGSQGWHGFVTDLVRNALEGGAVRPGRLYACGTLAMQHQVAKLAVEYGLTAELSLESLMACGLGACLGCALPAWHPTDPDADHYVHVCKHGPIFSPGSIRWQRLQFHRAQPPIFLSS